FYRGGKDQVTAWAQSLRGKLGLVGGEKTPLWNTEGGVPSPSYYSWLGAEEQSRAAARTVAKTLILNRAAGVQRYYYYYVWQERGGPRTFDWLYANNWALLDYDGSGKPSLAAFAACARSLEGAEPAGRVETSSVKAYLFRRGGDTVVALWSPAALLQPVDLKLKLDPQRLQVQNLMGNRKGFAVEEGAVVLGLRNEPVYLRAEKTPVPAVSAALRAALDAAPADGAAH
ncbi:MAG TPA: hypothetical protein VFU47_00190, partial [Armatimonadota bacterium]|nr:hypothetical protein [Armatimonadota bacterium]